MEARAAADRSSESIVTHLDPRGIYHFGRLHVLGGGLHSSRPPHSLSAGTEHRLAAAGDVYKIRTDMLDEGGLRTHLSGGPVNFVIEEDTCAGDPDIEPPEDSSGRY